MMNTIKCMLLDAQVKNRKELTFAVCVAVLMSALVISGAAFIPTVFAEGSAAATLKNASELIMVQLIDIICVISTPACAVIGGAAFFMQLSPNERTVQKGRSWMFRALYTLILVNCLGFIYVTVSQLITQLSGNSDLPGWETRPSENST